MQFSKTINRLGLPHNLSFNCERNEMERGNPHVKFLLQFRRLPRPDCYRDSELNGFFIFNNQM